MKLLKGLRRLVKRKNYDITKAVFQRSADEYEVFLGVLPDGHLGCFKCEKPWFRIESLLEPDHVMAGCDKCGFGHRMNILGGVWETKHMLLRGSPEASSILTCPVCGCSKFAVVKSNHVVSIGCKSCEWDMLISFIPRQDKGIKVIVGSGEDMPK